MSGKFVLGEVIGLESKDCDTLTKLFHYRMTTEPDRVVYVYMKNGNWVDVTWGQYARIVNTAAMGFKALGIERGDKVAILSDINYEWYYLNMALVSIGAITIGIYHTDPPNQCEYILQHSDSRIVISEDQEQVDKVFEIWENLPLLEKMVVKDKFAQKGHPRCMTLEAFLDLGKKTTEKAPDLFEKELLETKPDDIVTFVYTSGTTGPPKAAMLTHANALAVGYDMKTFRGFSEKDLSVDFLPMAHIGGQMISQFSRFYTNHKSVIAESWLDALYNIWEHQPTTFTSTPRQFEKFYNTVLSRLGDATWFQRKCYQFGIRIRKKALGYKDRKQSLPPLLRFLNGFAFRYIFHNIRDQLGGKVSRICSGGAPLAREIVEFFHIIGAPILEAYGMTETGSAVADSSIEVCRVGASGKVLPGLEVKIADDGEILARSPGNCKGYYKNPEATAELFEGGWLHTGDVGEFDDDGFLFITDRKKDLFITAGGKNVAPGNIENVMKTIKYVNQCMVYGDQKKYLTALYTLDEDEIVKYARDNRVIFKDTKELTQLPEIKTLIENEIREKNKELARFETIKKFIILPEDFDQDKQEVTATQKVKRKIVTEKFQDRLEALYSEK
ncbi:AMP-dependent synthetase/ligase [Thermodesulfobacteriota bacterium]